MTRAEPRADDGDESSIEISIGDPAKGGFKTVEPALIGERFGSYLLVGELAVGGMAELFVAVQKGLEGFVKVVVLKRVLPHLTTNDQFTRMFVDEARLAARLEHPNIVRTHEFGEVSGQYFTAMEYLPGEDLHKILNALAASKQQMPANMAAWIVGQVCNGLHFAHQLTDTGGRPLSLVHRDVKPANVVVTYRGQVKLVDFGVAKIRSQADTRSGTIKGKVAYMSPEQLLSRGVDQRSDVFSIGVVLWELLAGRPLFTRDSEPATLYAIMNDPIPPPSRYRPDVPKQLDAIVERALARTPVDRYDTADEMASALDGFLAGESPCDARTVSRMLEELFGASRADAKRSIAQGRSLPGNLATVMKLRSEARTGLADRLEVMPAQADKPVRAGGAMTNPILAGILTAVVVIGIGVGLYLMRRDGHAVVQLRPESAHLSITSIPPGADVFLAGEPTGLKTPALVSDLAGTEVTIRLDLAGHLSRTDTFPLARGRTHARELVIEPEPQPASKPEPRARK